MQGSDMADRFFSATRGNTMEHNTFKTNSNSSRAIPDIFNVRQQPPVFQPASSLRWQEAQQIESQERERTGKSRKRRREPPTPPLPNLGQPGALDDPLRIGLSPGTIQWYLRLLAIGYAPDMARKAALDRKDWQQRHRQLQNRPNTKMRDNADTLPQNGNREERGVSVATSTVAETSTGCASTINSIEVFVLPKEFPAYTLSNEEQTALERAIMQDTLHVTGARLRFGGFHYGSEMLIVNCETPHTAEWLTQQTPKLSTWQGVELIACTADNVPKFHTVSIFFPNSIGQEASTLFSMVESQNEGLSVRSWKVLSSKIEGTGQHLTIRICEKSFETIKKAGNLIYYKLGKIPVLDNSQEAFAASTSERKPEQQPQKSITNVKQTKEVYTVSIFFPNSVGQNDDKLLSMVERQNNGLPIQSWKVLNSKSEGTGKHLTIRVCDHSFETIKKAGNFIYFGLGKIPVTVHPQETPSSNVARKRQHEEQSEEAVMNMKRRRDGHTVSIFFPRSVGQKPKEILSLVESQNKGLSVQSWKVLSSTNEATGQRLMINICEQSFATIRNTGNYIYYRLGKIPVSDHQQETPASSMVCEREAEQQPQRAVMNVNQREDVHTVSIFFPNSIGKKGKTLFSLLKSQNEGLTVQSWKVLNARTVDGGQHYTIRICEQSFEMIKKAGNILNYGLGKISVSVLPPSVTSINERNEVNTISIFFPDSVDLKTAKLLSRVENQNKRLYIESWKVIDAKNEGTGKRLTIRISNQSLDVIKKAGNLIYYMYRKIPVSVHSQETPGSSASERELEKQPERADQIKDIHTISLFFPKKVDLDAKELLSMVASQNEGLPVQSWSVISSKNKGNGKHVMIRICKKSFETIEKAGNFINYELGKLPVWFHSKGTPISNTCEREPEQQQQRAVMNVDQGKEFHTVSIFFPNSIGRKANELLSFVESQNEGLSVGSWKVLGSKNEGTGQHLTIRVCQKSFEIIKEAGNSIYYRFGKISVSVHPQETHASFAGHREPEQQPHSAVTNVDPAKELHTVSILFPNSVNKDVEKVLSLVETQNEGLNVRSWKVLDSKNEGTGQQLTIRICQKSLEMIKQAGNSIYYRFGKIPVSFHPEETHISFADDTEPEQHPQSAVNNVDEEKEFHTVSIFFPNSVGQDANELLSFVESQNEGLSVRSWKVLDSKSEDTDQQLTIRICQKSFEMIKKAGNCIHYKFGKIPVSAQPQETHSSFIGYIEPEQQPQTPIMNMDQEKELHTVSIFFPNSVDQEVNKIFSLVETQNVGLNVRSWKVLDSKNEGTGQKLTIRICQKSFEMIKQAGNSIYYRFGKIPVSIYPEEAPAIGAGETKPEQQPQTTVMNVEQKKVVRIVSIFFPNSIGQKAKTLFSLLKSQNEELTVHSWKVLNARTVDGGQHYTIHICEQSFETIRKAGNFINYGFGKIPVSVHSPETPAIMSINERKEGHTISIFLPNGKDQKAKTLFSLLASQNEGLTVKSWKILEARGEGKGQHFTIRICEQSFETIRKAGNFLNYGFGKIPVSVDSPETPAVMSINERKEVHTIFIFFPNSMDEKPKTVLSLLASQNEGLNVQSWKVLNARTVGTGKHFTIRICEQSFETIKKAGNFINYGLDKIPVSVDPPAVMSINETNEVNIISIFFPDSVGLEICKLLSRVENQNKRLYIESWKVIDAKNEGTGKRLTICISNQSLDVIKKAGNLISYMFREIPVSIHSQETPALIASERELEKQPERADHIKEVHTISIFFPRRAGLSAQQLLSIVASLNKGLPVQSWNVMSSKNKDIGKHVMIRICNESLETIEKAGNFINYGPSKLPVSFHSKETPISNTCEREPEQRQQRAVINVDEGSEFHTVSIFFPNSVGQEAKGLLSFVESQNEGLSVRSWKVLSSKNEGTGQHLTVRVCQKSFEVIKQAGYSIYYRFGKISVSVHPQETHASFAAEREPEHQPHSAATNVDPEKELHTISIFFPNSVNKEVEKVFSLVETQNEGLNVRSWKVLDSKNEGTGKQLTIRICQKSLETIKQAGNSIYYRFGKIPVSFHSQETHTSFAGETERKQHQQSSVNNADEEKEFHTVSIVFPNSVDQEAKELLSSFECQNEGLSVRSWKVLGSKTEGTSQQLTIRICQNSFEMIKQAGNFIHYKFGKIPVSVHPEEIPVSGTGEEKPEARTQRAAMNVEKRKEVHNISIFFPDSVGREPKKLLSFIESQNEGLNVRSWKVLKSKNQDMGQHLTIRIDRQSFEAIKKAGNSIFYGFSQIPVSYHPHETCTSEVEAERHPMNMEQKREIHIVSIFFPNSVGQDVKKLFSLIESQNEGLTVPSWKVLDSKNEGTGQQLTIRIDRQSFEAIKKAGNLIFYASDQVPVSHLPQDTPASSESLREPQQHPEEAKTDVESVNTSSLFGN